MVETEYSVGGQVFIRFEKDPKFFSNWFVNIFMYIDFLNFTSSENGMNGNKF